MLGLLGSLLLLGLMALVVVFLAYGAARAFNDRILTQEELDALIELDENEIPSDLDLSDDEVTDDVEEDCATSGKG